MLLYSLYSIDHGVSKWLYRKLVSSRLCGVKWGGRNVSPPARAHVTCVAILETQRDQSAYFFLWVGGGDLIVFCYLKNIEYN